jgi:hypothetical protein
MIPVPIEVFREGLTGEAAYQRREKAGREVP